MTLVDSNVWLAVVLSGHDFHDTARDWLGAETALGGTFFCRATQQCSCDC
jgi:predicted nucleic acid-binding protein